MKKWKKLFLTFTWVNMLNIIDRRGWIVGRRWWQGFDDDAWQSTGISSRDSGIFSSSFCLLTKSMFDDLFTVYHARVPGASWTIFTTPIPFDNVNVRLHGSTGCFYAIAVANLVKEILTLYSSLSRIITPRVEPAEGLTKNVPSRARIAQRNTKTLSSTTIGTAFYVGKSLN